LKCLNSISDILYVNNVSYVSFFFFFLSQITLICVKNELRRFSSGGQLLVCKVARAGNFTQKPLTTLRIGVSVDRRARASQQLS
jgi:hypothetical protein